MNNNDPLCPTTADKEDDINNAATTARTPPGASKVWTEVGAQLEQNSSVGWKAAVESLELASQYLLTSEDARNFVEKRCESIVSILLDQNSTKMETSKRSCVEDSLHHAIEILSKDIRAKLHQTAVLECKILSVGTRIFNRKSPYYKGVVKSPYWNNSSNNNNDSNQASTLAEVRMIQIRSFFLSGGFAALPLYLDQSFNCFPDLEILHYYMSALFDLMIEAAKSSVDNNDSSIAVAVDQQEEVLRISFDDVVTASIDISKVIMKFLIQMDEKTLKENKAESFNRIRDDMVRLFDYLSSRQRRFLDVFYDFWREWTFKLISNPSLLVRLQGWQEVVELIDASAKHRPPPRSYTVRDAGIGFVNGRYEYAGKLTIDGFADPTLFDDVKYVHKVPDDASEGAAKVITLFRCQMRSQAKWWFISEADKDEPGTDKDIDYYQHRSKREEESEPPLYGWATCSKGKGPEPVLNAEGSMVPSGEEFNTLEHKLAHWAIEKKVIEMVLGQSVHREVVARSQPLLKFLAMMCKFDSRREGLRRLNTTITSCEYCLRPSHLLLAWDTCMTKADAAVSAEIYQILVSLLPDVTESLAIELLQSIHKSLSVNGNENLFEVGEFCASLSSLSLGIDSTNQVTNTIFTDRVRTELLKLLWSVLSHPDAPSLNCYQKLKTYIHHGLRVEPMGMKHREAFLLSCMKSLQASARSKSLNVINEQGALGDVRLIRFILDACPIVQAQMFVKDSHFDLARLLFEETIAYLERQQFNSTSDSTKMSNYDIVEGLDERFTALQFVYGLCDDYKMKSSQLDRLWELCGNTNNVERLMIFISSASNLSERSNATTIGTRFTPQEDSGNTISAAFSLESISYAFQKLYCSSSTKWDQLGLPAYKSFQRLFNGLRKGQRPPLAGDFALSSLWNISISTQNEDVAARAMGDLLNLYTVATPSFSYSDAALGTGRESDSISPQEHFLQRIFDFLEKIKNDLETGASTSYIAAERCLNILHEGFGDISDSGLSRNTLTRLSSPSSNSQLFDMLRNIPHGLLGQSSYIRITIQVRRTNTSQKSKEKKLSLCERIPLEVHPLETLQSLKKKISNKCKQPLELIKLISATLRKNVDGKNATSQLNNMSDDCIVSQLGLTNGSEIVTLFTPNPLSSNQSTSKNSQVAKKIAFLDLRDVFTNNGERLFCSLISLLDALASEDIGDEKIDSSRKTSMGLIWDLLRAMPTNSSTMDHVNQILPDVANNVSKEGWDKLLFGPSIHRGIYTLQVIDLLLQPAPEMFSSMGDAYSAKFTDEIMKHSADFRDSFIRLSGFHSVLSFFVTDIPGSSFMSKTISLRVLKCCLTGTAKLDAVDNLGMNIINSLSKEQMSALIQEMRGLVMSRDEVPDNGVYDIVAILRLLLSNGFDKKVAPSDSSILKELLMALLVWDSGDDLASINSSQRVRLGTQELILGAPQIGQNILSWMVSTIDELDYMSESMVEFFNVLQSLIEQAIGKESCVVSEPLIEIGAAVSRKIALHPILEEAVSDILAGCLRVLRVLVLLSGGKYLLTGVKIMLDSLDVTCWAQEVEPSSFSNRFLGKGFAEEDKTLLNLIGCIFDGCLSPNDDTKSPLCCEKVTRELGFGIMAAAAQRISNGHGYTVMAQKFNQVVSTASYSLRHHWCIQSSRDSDNMLVTSKFHGLKNQGCTCYMNSFLQQLFMMPGLRDNICSAPIPSSLRASGGGQRASNANLVGETLSIQWESGTSYVATVEKYDEKSGMHTIRYLPQAMIPAGLHSTKQLNKHIYQFEEPLEELLLSEGRPGKETGMFKIVTNRVDPSVIVESPSTHHNKGEKVDSEESEEAIASRRLLEEVQKTFVNLKEGSLCFDPRSLVEASGCLKLEFDVWQQNDASEYAMKLLDRLEVPLKKWAPQHYHYLIDTFGLKQTKQKICKECGLKTNIEENLMSIDCQIRGKEDIYESLSSFCEVDYMYGDNKVNCDRCDKKCDTVLRTAISALPEVLILSLKRFDLDFNTFETVKLNSRCAFDQTLNMKQYTLEGVELLEKIEEEMNDMQIDGEDPLKDLPDEDYEYKLVGVLVHAGVAQGGHYYSYIKDRCSENDWYRFDDEDVTPFDPSQIENECFGGKIKKETKWSTGQVTSVESEQFANALMLFYEKAKPVPREEKENSKGEEHMDTDLDVDLSSGIDVFQSEVKRARTCHKWHSFMTDLDFQSFLKTFFSNLGSESVVGSSKWLESMLEFITHYVFDVLFHSTDKDEILNDWAIKLSLAFLTEKKLAVWFLETLLQKSGEVSGNWLRVYCTECPEKSVRQAANKVFLSAIQACVSCSKEQILLENWIKSYRSHWESLDRSMSASPMSIDQEVAEKKASLVGSLLTYLSGLLELMPLRWPTSMELFALLRELALSKIPGEKNILREALIACEFPARLIVFLLRERSPPPLKNFFPGTSMSVQTAEGLVRREVSVGLNLTSNNHVHNTVSFADNGSHNIPFSLGLSVADQEAIIETLSVMIGVKGADSAPLLEQGPTVKDSTLTTDAKVALTLVFMEAEPEKDIGMSQDDIHRYMERCGINNIHPHRIASILAKYPTVSSKDGTTKGKERRLSREGFLSFYRDTAETHESRVRTDLHMWGFRRNLKRRKDEHLRSDKVELDWVESVSLDVAADEWRPDFGNLTSIGLLSLNFISQIYFTSEYYTTYLLATAAYERNTYELIIQVLKDFSRAPSGWAGEDTFRVGTTILKVLLALPDNLQQERMLLAMEGVIQGQHKQSDVGILVFGNERVNQIQRSQHDSDHLTDIVNRYIEILKELYKVQAVKSWMSENKSTWSWVEKWMRRTQSATNTNYIGRGNTERGEKSSLIVQSPPHSQKSAFVDANSQNNASDMDSSTNLYSFPSEDEEEDLLHDDSHYGEYIIVHSSGSNVSGRYEKIDNDDNEDVCIFQMVEGENVGISIEGRDSLWKIQSVGADSVCFYEAPRQSFEYYPPKDGWSCGPKGLEPLPVIEIATGSVAEEDWR